MGGHQQFEECLTLEEAVGAFRRYVEYYEKRLGLHLSYAQITYDVKDKKYKLAMRFPK